MDKKSHTIIAIGCFQNDLLSPIELNTHYRKQPFWEGIKVVDSRPARSAGRVKKKVASKLVLLGVLEGLYFH